MKILIKTKFDERLDPYTTLVHHVGEADLDEDLAKAAIEAGYAELLEQDDDDDNVEIFQGEED